MARRRVVRCALSVLLGATLLLPVAKSDAQEDPAPPERADLTATPLTPTGRVEGARAPTSDLAESDQELIERTDSEVVPVLIKLDYDAIATYRGGSSGAEATSPSVTGEPLTPSIARTSEYARHVIRFERDVVTDLRQAAPSIDVGRRLRVVFGGVAATVPANQAADLLEVEGVVAVQSDAPEQLQTDSSPDFIGAPPVWDDLGGQDQAGAGVLFGSLDTGVWPEHPSFDGTEDLGPAPTDNEGDPITCDFGDNPLTPATDVFACNDKLVGGEPFLDTYLAVVSSPPEVYPDSARDSNGHGTHTASTAAGLAVDSAPIFGVERGPISGIAPGAWVSVYKVCGLEGCFPSDSAAAVESAIFDGVDVMNFSISGGSDPFSDAVELAFLDAYAANIFVAASAGNAGPGPSTADHLSAWVTTVAASTQTREFASALSLDGGGGDTLSLEGASIGTGIASPLPVVMASAPPYSDVGCLSEPPAADTFDGVIVACQRGPGRIARGFNVSEGGGEGMILYNATPADALTDNHWIPTVHLADGTEFLDFMDAHPSVTASFTAGVAQDGEGDVMTTFSSRGPGGLFVKPDVTAPGAQILAGHTPTPESIAEGPPGENFQAIAGTSMSSPHVAGAAILTAAGHPDWTPGQVKSALMTTAVTDVVKEDGATPADPFDFGAGRIDVEAAAAPGLTIADDAEGFVDLAGDPVAAIDVNLPSVNAPIMPGEVTTHRVVRNVSSGPAVYTVDTTAPPGTSITVSPSRFSIASGGSLTLTITVGAEVGTTGQQFGQIALSAPGRPDLHLPVAFVPGQGDISVTSDCSPPDIDVGATTSCAVTATNESGTDTTVDLTTTVDQHLEVTDVEPGAATHDATSASLEDHPLAGRDPGVPSLETFAPLGDGYFPLDFIGVTPIPIGDEEAIDFNVPPFEFNGVTYSSLSVVSNGYVVAGGPATSSDIQCCPPGQLPDPAPPNNVLAPFWADLTGDGDAAPDPDGIFAASVSGGGSSWVVIEFRLNAFDTDDLKVFQVWIGTGGFQDITFNYDPDHTSLDGLVLTEDGGGPTIGAENEDGSGGDQVDETPEEDNLPAVDYNIVSTDPEPGDSVTMTVEAKGLTPGLSTVRSEATWPIVGGVTRVETQVEVIRAATENDAYVAAVFNDLFGRDPSSFELDPWVTRLDAGTWTRLRFLTALTNTDEWRGLVVDRFYDQLLDPAPTAGERTTQIDRLESGLNERSLVGRLAGSAEFFAAAGGTNEGFVDLLFERLLGRDPTATEVDAQVARIEGGTPRSTVATSIYQRLESRNLRVDALFNQYLHHPPSPERRAHFAEKLKTQSDSWVTARLVSSQEYFDNAT